MKQYDSFQLENKQNKSDVLNQISIDGKKNEQGTSIKIARKIEEKKKRMNLKATT